MVQPDQLASDWHTRTVAEAISALETHAQHGLSAAAARERLARLGPNVLTQERAEPWYEEIVESLTEPLQLMLIGVGVLYALFGEFADAATIFAVIFAVAGAETFNEARAKQAIASLRTLSAPTATIVRDGQPAEIGAA